MTTSTLITDYLGEGLHAARPATPNIPAGGTAIYYETDTTNTFAWSGSAWVQINGTGGGGGPAVVQRAVGSIPSLAVGLTLGSAPVMGNWLIAIVQDENLFTNLVPGTGWAIHGAGFGRIDINGSSNSCLTGVGPLYAYTFILTKLAGAGESATQTPVTNATLGSIAMWEVAGGSPGMPVGASNNNASNATMSVTYYEAAGQLTLGAFLTSDSVAPASTSGLSNIQNASTTGAAVTAFDDVGSVASTPTVATTNTAVVYKGAIVLPMG